MLSEDSLTLSGIRDNDPGPDNDRCPHVSSPQVEPRRDLEDGVKGLGMSDVSRGPGVTLLDLS